MKIVQSLKKLKADILRSKSARHLGFIYSSKVITAALRLGASIALARKLGAEGIGILTVAAVNMGLLAIVLDMGLATTLIRKLSLHVDQGDDEKAAGIFRRIFTFSVVVSGAMLVAAYYAAPYVARNYYGNEALVTPLRLAVIGAFVYNIWNHVNGVLRALEKFKHIAVISIVSQTVRTGLILLFGYVMFFLDVKYAMLCNISQVAVAFIICSVFIPRRIYSIKGAKPYPFREIFSYSGWMYLFHVLFTLFDRLDVLMLSYFRQEYEVGLYGIAYIMIRPFEMIPQTLNVVFLPKVSKYTKKHEIFRYFRNTLKITGLVAIVGLVSVFIAKPVIVAFYGAEFLPSVKLFQILVGAFVLLVILTPLSLVGHTINKPQVFVLWSIINLVLNFIGNIMFIPKYGAIGAAMVTLVSRVLGSLIGFAVIALFIKRWAEE